MWDVITVSAVVAALVALAACSLLIIWGRKRRNDRVQAIVSLNEMVLRGAISSVETNVESRKAGEPYRAIVTVGTDDVVRRERIRLQVRQVLEPFGDGVEVQIERAIPDTRNPSL